MSIYIFDALKFRHRIVCYILALYQLWRSCTSEQDEKIATDSKRTGKGGSDTDVTGGTAAAIVWKD
jgi:hypothetical protein